MSILIKKF